jgi:hypothetical protein
MNDLRDHIAKLLDDAAADPSLFADAARERGLSVHQLIGAAVSSLCYGTNREYLDSANLVLAAADLLSASRSFLRAYANLEAHEREGRTTISKEMRYAAAQARAAVRSAEGRGEEST